MRGTRLAPDKPLEDGTTVYLKAVVWTVLIAAGVLTEATEAAGAEGAGGAGGALLTAVLA